MPARSCSLLPDHSFGPGAIRLAPAYCGIWNNCQSTSKVHASVLQNLRVQLSWTSSWWLVHARKQGVWRLRSMWNPAWQCLGQRAWSRVIASSSLISSMTTEAVACRGPRYLEIDTDVGSSSTAHHVTGMVQGALKSIVVDIGVLLEGRATVSMLTPAMIRLPTSATDSPDIRPHGTTAAASKASGLIATAICKST